MIVPPRLVAGCVFGFAAAAFLLATPADGLAQTAAGQKIAQNAESRQPATAPHAAQSGVRRASWRMRGWDQARPGYMPAHLRGAGSTFDGALEGQSIHEGQIIQEGQVEVLPEGSPIPEAGPGEIIYDHPPAPGAFDEGFVGGHADGFCGEGCCGGSGCGDGCCAPCAPATCCLIPCLGLPHNFLAYGGIHGFKGPLNRGSDSSFGFDEALNWGGPINICGCGVGAQFGVRGAHSNLSGATGLTLDDRNQLFLTGGLFRRVDCGLQWGVAYDYLQEDWDVQLELAQLRSELSWVFVTQSEVGFRYTTPVMSDTSNVPPAVAGTDWEPVETFLFFFRQKVAPIGAEAQAYAGFSAESEGIIGADMLIPLADHLGVVADFTYLVPEQGAAAIPVPGSLDESWNISLGVVMYPDAGFLNPANYYRPLFNVANNGSFLVDVDN